MSESLPVYNIHGLTSKQSWNWVTHRVTGSMGHLGHLSRLGHRVIIVTRYETRIFSNFRTNAENAQLTF